MTRGVALLALLLAAWVTPLDAQAPPALDRVEELVRSGNTEEARAALLSWWASEGARAARRDVQRGLWLRGRLTVDPVQAQVDFRRLVIEFPGGPWSDQALFRLAQAAWASGDAAGAAAHVDRLAREYPTSPVRREAEAWLAEAGPAPEPPASALPAERPVETAVEPPTGANAATEPAVRPEVAPATTAGGPFAVQLGAFSSLERAEGLLRRVSDAGFDARLVRVPGSDLVRVRVGTFDSAEGAGAILRRLQDLGFQGALARDAHREERVR